MEARYAMLDYGKTLQELITDIRDELHEPTESEFSDEHIVRAVNSRIEELVKLIVKEDENYFEFFVENLDMTINTRGLSLEAYPFYRISRVERTDLSANKPIPLQIVSYKNRYEYEAGMLFDSTYPKVSIRNKYLEFIPIPSATVADCIKVYGMRTPFKLHYGTAQAGAATTITLATSATKGSVETTNDYYKYCWLKITSGTGAGQIRQVSSYVGSTKVATVDTAWTTNPSTDSVYSFLPMNAGYNRVLVLGAALDMKRPLNLDVKTLEKHYDEALSLLLQTIKETQFSDPRYINYQED